MKRLLIVVGIVVLVLLLVLAGVFFYFKYSSTAMGTSAATPTATTGSSNPFAVATTHSNSLVDFTTTCFKVYAQDAINQVQLQNPKKVQQDAQPCFTSDFIQKWPTISASSDSDPVLLSNDFFQSWGSQVTSSVLTQSATDGTVLVRLGSGAELLQLVATLQKTSNGWRISSVAHQNS